MMRCALCTIISMVLVCACSSPAPVVTHPAEAADSWSSEIELPTYLLGEVPSVTIIIRCVFGGDVLVSNGTSYNARDCRKDFGSAPVAKLVVDGPEAKTQSVRLSVSEGKPTWSREAGRWVLDPIENKTVALTRFLTPGRYRVSIRATESMPSDAGLELLVEPSAFDVIAGPAAPVVDLPRKSIDTPERGFADVVVPSNVGWVFAESFSQGFEIHTEGRERYAPIPDGKYGAMAASSDVVAVFHTNGDGAPTVALFDSALKVDKTIALLPGSSLRGEEYMRIVWNEEAAEWAVAWTAYEKLTDAEKVRKRGNGCQIEMGGGISRTYMARISKAGAVTRTLVGEVNLVDLAANGGEYGVLTSLADCEWRSVENGHEMFRLTNVRSGTVTQHYTFQRPKCQSHAPSILLSHTKDRYVAVLTWGRWGNGTHRLEVVGLDADGVTTAAGDVIVDPERDIDDVSLVTYDGVAWLSYVAVEKRTRREQVVVVRLGADLSPDAAFVVDDGYDRVSALELIDDGETLSLAVVRRFTDPFVIDLSSLQTPAELLQLSLTDLAKPTTCETYQEFDRGPNPHPDEEVTGSFGVGRSSVDP